MVGHASWPVLWPNSNRAYLSRAMQLSAKLGPQDCVTHPKLNTLEALDLVSPSAHPPISKLDAPSVTKPKRPRPSSSIAPPASKRPLSPKLNPTQQLASLHISDRSLGAMATPQATARFDQLAKEWSKGELADPTVVLGLLSQLKASLNTSTADPGWAQADFGSSSCV